MICRNSNNNFCYLASEPSIYIYLQNIGNNDFSPKVIYFLAPIAYEKHSNCVNLKQINIKYAKLLLLKILRFTLGFEK